MHAGACPGHTGNGRPRRSRAHPARSRLPHHNCKEGDPIQGEIRTVTFIVKQEDGRDVIDDNIHTFSTKYAFDRYEGL